MAPFRKRVKYFLLVLLVRFLFWITSWMPTPILKVILVGMSSIAYLILGKEKQRAFEHLQIAFPEKSDEEIRHIVRQMFHDLAVCYADMIKGMFIKNKEEFHKRVDVRGKENIDKAYEKGKGVIVIIPHLGAYELIGLYSGLNFNTTAVGARMKNPQLDELLVKYRTSKGSEYIHRDESPIKLVKALKKGYVVGMLVDQDTSKVKNVFVDFFGKKAATPVGPATLQRKLNAAVVPVAITMVNGRQVMHIGEELEMVKTEDEQQDLIINTQRMLQSSEYYIRRFPTQWVWFHQRWKTKPTEEMN